MTDDCGSAVLCADSAFLPVVRRSWTIGSRAPQHFLYLFSSLVLRSSCSSMFPWFVSFISVESLVTWIQLGSIFFIKLYNLFSPSLHVSLWFYVLSRNPNFTGFSYNSSYLGPKFHNTLLCWLGFCYLWDTTICFFKSRELKVFRIIRIHWESIRKVPIHDKVVLSFTGLPAAIQCHGRWFAGYLESWQWVTSCGFLSGAFCCCRRTGRSRVNRPLICLQPVVLMTRPCRCRHLRLDRSDRSTRPTVCGFRCSQRGPPFPSSFLPTPSVVINSPFSLLFFSLLFLYFWFLLLLLPEMLDLRWNQPALVELCQNPWKVKVWESYN